MVSAVAGSAGCGAADCRHRKLPNDRSHAKKEQDSTKRNIRYWAIPPEADADFTAHGNDVLDVCSQPYDPQVPPLGIDDQPAQLVAEPR